MLIYKKRFSKLQAGFSFIELMVVILLLGIMATILIPNIAYVRPGYERRAFVAQVNNLLRFAWRDALISQKIHRIHFDLKKRIIRVQVEGAEHGNEKKFYDVKTQYVKSWYEWPEHIIIKQLFVGKEEQLQRPGTKTESAWFFIVPEGMSQEVIINALTTIEKDEKGKEKQIGLVINPFTAQLNAYETFQKP